MFTQSMSQLFNQIYITEEILAKYTHTHTHTHTHIYIYIYTTTVYVSISLGGLEVDQMRNNLESAQYQW